MGNIKSYTDLEQSKRLAEILPFGSEDGALTENYHCIPCWSLASLLSILPRFIDFGTRCTFLIIYPTQNLGWVVEYSNDNSDEVDFAFDNKNLIDSCYEMIVKLHEMKLL